MAYIHSYETFGTVDGPGLRFVVFLQGCPLRCKYCHNPDTWLKSNAKIIESAEDTFKRIMRYRHYYIFEGGVTVTGGEPLMQPEYVCSLFKLCRHNALHTALDTSGFFLDEQVKEAVAQTDLVMLDLKAIEPKVHKSLTGAEQQPVLNFLDYLASINKTTWIRHVVVPGITDDEESLKKTAEFIKDFPNVKKADVLAYHTLGVHKWKQLGIPYPLEGIAPLSDESFKRAKQIFLNAGLNLA